MILSIFLSEIMILSFSSIIIISYVANQQEEQIYSNAIEICKNYSNRLNGDFKESIAISKSLSNSIEISNINNKQQMILLLKMILNYNDKIIGSYICYDLNYLNESDTDTYEINYYQNNKFCPYCFKESDILEIRPLAGHELINLYFEKKNNSSIITTPFYFNDNFILSIFSPILNKDTTIGVVGLDISLSYIDTIVNNVRLFDSGYAFFVSNNGIFLSHPIDKSFIGLKTIYDLGDPIFIEAANDIKNKKSGIFKTKDPLSDQEVIVFYEPIMIDGSSFLLVIPEHEIIDSIYQLMRKLIAISLFSLMFIATISYIISSWISSSIKKITHDLTFIANKIANGELNIGTKLDVDTDFQPILLGLDEILKAITNHIIETKKII